MRKFLSFCYWVTGEILNNPLNLFNEILFSDKTTLTTNGGISSQNCRPWSAKNPEFVIDTKKQYSQKVIV